MRRLLDNLLNLSRYERRLDKERAQMIYAIAALLFVLYTTYVFLVPQQSSAAERTFFENASTETLHAVAIAAFYGCFLVSIIATRSGSLTWGSYGLLGVVYFGVCLIGLYEGYIFADDTIPLLIFVFLGGLLLQERGVLLAGAIALVTFFLGVQMRDEVPTGALNSVITIPLMLLAAVGITYLFLRVTGASRQEALIQRESERLKLADITTSLAQRISRRLALSDVLSGAVEEICADYPDIYHAQIFLIDDAGAEARLAASTGAVGRMLLERGHKLEVGSQSVIGQVTAQGEVVIARVGSPNSIHRHNEFLPDTVVEAAFPLRIGETVIGALDLQTRSVSAFADSDIPIFQSLADSIAVAIDNARLFEEAQRNIQENQQLAERAQQAVREVERLNQQLTRELWEQYLIGKQGMLGLSIDFSEGTAQPGDEWTPALSEAIRENRVVQQGIEGAQIVSVPLRLRGQVIGAMEFELDEQGNLTAEDLDLMQQVSERFGLAVENARLFEESQRVAQREALVNEIGSRLQTSTSIETVLQEAARSLQQSLNAGRVAIRLGSPPDQGVNGAKERI